MSEEAVQLALEVVSCPSACLRLQRVPGDIVLHFGTETCHHVNSAVRLFIVAVILHSSMSCILHHCSNSLTH